LPSRWSKAFKLPYHRVRKAREPTPVDDHGGACDPLGIAGHQKDARSADVLRHARSGRHVSLDPKFYAVAEPELSRTGGA
jgi:hypothetical protein